MTTVDPISEAREALHAIQQLLSHEDGPLPEWDAVVDQAEEVARTVLARLDALPAPERSNIRNQACEPCGWFYWDPSDGGDDA
jgi:hypothetical protein